MKSRYKILIVIATTMMSLLVSDQYYLSLQDKELKESDWVQNCIPVGSDRPVPAIGLFNHTHSFDLQTCSWNPTEHGTPGFLESLYISFIEPVFLDIADALEIKYAHAACAAPLFGPPGPCFDSFSMSHTPLNEKSIMEQYARNIELNFGDWEFPDRNWSDEKTQLNLPAILCTEFISDGQTHHRMAKWVDTNKISSWENHYNPLLCDKWLPPIDDGIKLKWDKELYPSDDIAQIQVIDKDMNLDPALIDSFDIHVFSDTDHTGIQLTVTETEPDAGYFYGNVFLTTTDESSGARLLVEDAIWADYKMNRIFSKIINEQRESYDLEIIDESDITTCNVIHIPIINYALDDCEDIESFKSTLIALIVIIPIALVVIFKYKRKF